MRSDARVQMDEVPFVVVLSACAKDASLHGYDAQLARELEAEGGALWRSLQIQAQCVLSHANVGDVAAAQRVFDEQVAEYVKRSEVSVWNALIQSFARNRMAQSALKAHRAMGAEVLIHSCSHCGLVREAKQVFEQYARGDGESVELFAAMTDCYARGGHLKPVSIYPP